MLRPAVAPALALLLGAVGMAGAMASALAEDLAAEQGITASGRRYAIGGISEAEQAALTSKRADYSLWVLTATRGSGAWLADVRVRIVDERQHLLFDRVLAGPWLMIDLPLGRYEVQASRGAQVQRQTTTIHPGDHHQAHFYFADDAGPGPGHPGPLPSAPDGR